MRSVVSHEMDPLDGPPLTVREVFFFETWKDRGEILRSIPVSEILDLRTVARWIRDDIVFERHRNVDQASRHCASLFYLSCSCGPVRTTTSAVGRMASGFHE